MNEKRTILVVDDSEFDRSLLVKVLSRKSDFNILEASTGEECLELLKSHTFDLILMDIMLPGKFGTQILMSIREKFNAIELPIIMITAKVDATDVIGCLQLGANDYITKPVHFDIALSRISTHLKLSEASREMARLQEIAALHSMITTYHHEINNPLAIALGSLEAIERKQNDKKALKSAHDALWRVADIVKKIRDVAEKREVQYVSYGEFGKMVKVK